MKKYSHCVYILMTVVIAMIASAILYRSALSAYSLSDPAADYFSTVMLLKGMFGMLDLGIAVWGAFLCIKLSHQNR